MSAPVSFPPLQQSILKLSRRAEGVKQTHTDQEGWFRGDWLSNSGIFFYVPAGPLFSQTLKWNTKPSSAKDTWCSSRMMIHTSVGEIWSIWSDQCEMFFGRPDDGGQDGVMMNKPMMVATQRCCFRMMMRRMSENNRSTDCTNNHHLR